MKMIKSLLPKYHDILMKETKASYLNCKQIPVSFKGTQSTDELWMIHDEALELMNVKNTIPPLSLLDLKIELADRIFQECCFCEHKCKVNRRKIAGRCGVQDSHIVSEFLHFGEEPILVPSHTIFFSGCTFHCVFCQNWDISQYLCGTFIDPKDLVNIIERRKKQGARNVNWVGGDPTSNLLYILQNLKKLNSNIAQIWNSNMYCSEETMKLLHGVIDVYLTDFKYGNDLCAKRLSKIERYTATVKRNHKLAYCHGEVIIRHLALPNHIKCCAKPIIKFLAENLPDGVVNIMDQFRPEYMAYEYKEMSRSVLPEEILQIKEFARNLGIYQI